MWICPSSERLDYDASGNRIDPDDPDAFEYDANQRILRGPGGQKQRERRGQGTGHRCGDEEDQSGTQQPAPAEPVTEGTRGQQECRKCDVVGVDGPLGACDTAAEIVADRRQGQVDRVGVDQPDEQAQIGGDQG